MLKYVAYFFGGSMLLEGVWGLLAPRSGPTIWRRYLRNLLPSSLNKIYADYSSLSSRSIRYISVWTVVLGILFLALANPRRVNAPDYDYDKGVDYQI